MDYSLLVDKMEQYVLDTFRKGGQGMTTSGRMASPHPNTGAFENSVESKITTTENGVKIDVLAFKYGHYLNLGVSASAVNGMLNIRPRGQGGDGKTSKYITGLHSWVKTKLGISDEKTSLGIAFAIAKTHAEKGFPVRDNKLGSSWIDGDSEDQEKLDEIADMFFGLLEKEINKIWH